MSGEKCGICGEEAFSRMEVEGVTADGEKIVKGLFLCERHGEMIADGICRLLKARARSLQESGQSKDGPSSDGGR